MGLIDIDTTRTGWTTSVTSATTNTTVDWSKSTTAYPANNFEGKSYFSTSDILTGICDQLDDKFVEQIADRVIKKLEINRYKNLPPLSYLYEEEK